jgi:hypothetical protein
MVETYSDCRSVEPPEPAGVVVGAGVDVGEDDEAAGGEVDTDAAGDGAAVDVGVELVHAANVTASAVNAIDDAAVRLYVVMLFSLRG